MEIFIVFVVTRHMIWCLNHIVESFITKKEWGNVFFFFLQNGGHPKFSHFH